jgi:DMSO/TMAO reductase YedYZ molybdopterin-dependent catalytic subunit
MRDPRLTRRQALVGALAGLGLAACDSDHPRAGLLGAMERWNRGTQRVIFDSDLEATAGARTPEAAFPAYHAGPVVPALPPGWKLQIGGRVARPRALTLDDLMKLPRTDVRIEHHCVEGWSAVADWHGVRMREIAKLVGAADVPYVEFRSFDIGYWSSWDAASALHPQTLLAYGMNGRPLGPDHGAPVRLYGAVKLGYKNVKYLTEVSFLDRETGGYWENQGYEWFAGV